MYLLIPVQYKYVMINPLLFNVLQTFIQTSTPNIPVIIYRLLIILD